MWPHAAQPIQFIINEGDYLIVLLYFRQVIVGPSHFLYNWRLRVKILRHVDQSQNIHQDG
jgi:hypothetical protein